MLVRHKQNIPRLFGNLMKQKHKYIYVCLSVQVSKVKLFVIRKSWDKCQKLLNKQVESQVMNISNLT